jgi:catechol 2,3-dioxygenase-like lactoylglutathione lyase family enzyme
MKRLHVHVSVKDLAASIRFYRTLFDAEPVVTKPDYAKWMLEDPRVNFAISAHRQPVGINHLGLQVDTDEELRGMRAQLEAADAHMVEEKQQACCYARISTGSLIPRESRGKPSILLAESRSTARIRRSSITALRSSRSRALRLGAAFRRRNLSPRRVAARNDGADLQRPVFMHGQLGAQHPG